MYYFRVDTYTHIDIDFREPADMQTESLHTDLHMKEISRN